MYATTTSQYSPRVWCARPSVLPVPGSTSGSHQRLDPSTPTSHHVEWPSNPHDGIVSLVPLTLRKARSPVGPDQSFTAVERAFRFMFLPVEICCTFSDAWAGAIAMVKDPTGFALSGPYTSRSRTQSLQNVNAEHCCHCLSPWKKSSVHNTIAEIEETHEHCLRDIRALVGDAPLPPPFDRLFALSTSLGVVSIRPDSSDVETTVALISVFRLRDFRVGLLS